MKLPPSKTILKYRERLERAKSLPGFLSMTRAERLAAGLDDKRLKQAALDLGGLGGTIGETALGKEAEFQLQSRVIRWLEEKWPGPTPCPYCGVADWRVGTVLELRRLHSPDRALPVVLVTCGNCAQTVFINVLWAGSTE
jgi:hypothetical protein